ncbi:glycosyl transferase family 1 [Gemmatimonadetes bacterium T265]|nr:glycosyl transferase family 1 [Gemmatimonadetes bacterium T265]
MRVLAPAAAGLASDATLRGVAVRRYRYAARRDETLAYTGAMAETARGSWRGATALAGLVAAGALATRETARAWRPDVVHAHWWFPGGLSAALPGVLGGRPLVVTMHGSDVRLARQARSAHRLFDVVVRRAAAVTAVSSWLCAEARTMAPRVACHVAPMPVDAARYSPPPAGAPRSGLLFVGRLTAQKGVAQLLDAFARMRARTTLDVVGRGSEAAALRARAEAAGVADRVRWHDPQPPTLLAPWYRAASALVVPSTEEGFGLVAVEAMLCATPVVAFRSGGVTDVVRDGETGLLAPAGDVDALARCLDRIVTDDVVARKLGTAGRVDVAARFTPAAVANRYRALYDAVARTTP